MISFVCLYLVNDSDAENSVLHGNDVATVITATRSQGYFIKSRSLVPTRNQFLHLMRVDLVEGVRIMLQQLDDLEPRSGYRLDKPTIIRFSSKLNDDRL